MARSRRRTILTVLVVVVGLLVLATVLLPRLVPRDKLRAMAVERLRTATGGDVNLGEVSVRLWPRLRLVLGESRLTVTAEGLRRAGQQPGPLVRGYVGLKRFEIDLALVPLLKKRLEFGEIRLIGPDLNIATRTAPTDTGGVPGGGGGGGGGQSAAWGLAFAGVEVRDGTVTWQDADSGRRVALSGWQQDLTAPDLGLLLRRLQRLSAPGKADASADAAGDASLALDATIAKIELVGFGASPLPPLTDVTLKTTVTVPPATDRIAFDVSELSLPGWRATAVGQVALAPASGKQLSIENLTLTGPDGAAELAGQTSMTLPPTGGPLAADLHGTVDLATLPGALLAFLPPRPQGAASPPSLTGKLTVSLEAKAARAPALSDKAAWQAGPAKGLLDRFRLHAEGQQLSLAMPLLGEPLQIPRLDYTGDLHRAGWPQTLVLSDLAHPVVQGTAKMTIALGAKGRAHHIEAAVENLDLDALAAAMQKQAGDQQARRSGWSLVDAAHAAEARGTTAPGDLIPADLELVVKTTVAKVMLMKTPYTSVGLSGNLAHKVLTVTALDADLGGGDITGTGNVDYATDPQGVATFTLDASQVPASALLAPYVPQLAAIWTGNLQAHTSGSCRLGDKARITSSLAMTGMLDGANGRIDLKDMLGGLEPYLGTRADLLHVVYNKCKESFRIEDGKIKLSNLDIDGKDTDWTGSGSVGLDGALDLEFHVKLPPGFTPDLGDASFLADGLRDGDGRIGLDVKLTGNSRDPEASLDLDTKKILQNPKVQEEAKDKLKKAAGGLLDKLKGK